MKNSHLLVETKKTLELLKKKFEEAGCLCSLNKEPQMTTLIINYQNISQHFAPNKGRNEHLF